MYTVFFNREWHHRVDKSHVPINIVPEQVIYHGVLERPGFSLCCTICHANTKLLSGCFWYPCINRMGQQALELWPLHVIPCRKFHFLLCSQLWCDVNGQPCNEHQNINPPMWVSCYNISIALIRIVIKFSDTTSSSAYAQTTQALAIQGKVKPSILLLTMWDESSV